MNKAEIKRVEKELKELYEDYRKKTAKVYKEYSSKKKKLENKIFELKSH